MKIFKTLFVAILALGMVACNNEEVPEIIDGPEASISIKVFPSSNGSSTRLVGDLTNDGILPAGLAEESAIKKLEVWVFKGDILDAYGSSTTHEVLDIEAHIGLRDIVVVANANIGNIITSKTALITTLKNLPADVSTNGLIMTAEPFEITLEKGKNYWGYNGTDVAGEHKYHEANPLAITRVNARVAIVSATLDMTSVPADQQLYFDNLKNLEVAIFNVPNQTKLFGASLATNTDFQFGALWPSPDFSYVGVGSGTANTDLLFNKLTNLLPSAPIAVASAPYYYVNENTSAVVEGTSQAPAEKMIIVLRAKVYKGTDEVLSLEDLYTDEDGYTYYPVWVNAVKDNYTYNTGHTADGNVYRNTQYNINLTIKGLGRPTIDEVEKAWLDVNVVVAPWLVVTQDVEW